MPRARASRSSSRAGADVEADVGDGDDRVPAAVVLVVVGRGPDRIVMVARVGRIDRDDRQMRQVLALAERLLRDPLRLVDRLLRGIRARRPCLWIAIRLKLRGANGSPSTASTRAVTRGGRPDDFAQDEVARLGVLEVGDRQLAPLLLVDRRQPEALALLADHAEHQLGRALELLHRMRDIALPALLGPREDAVADAERAAPAALDHPQPRRRPVGVPCSGTAKTLPLSSTSTTRSTVTLGTPPDLWKARPGALSISPSSAMSLSSALSTILSWP